MRHFTTIGTAIHVNSKYLQKRSNVWFFRRRVPVDVKALYPRKKGFIDVVAQLRLRCAVPFPR
ncbi:DUF6538 domain-containing protein [uncultured Jannaschia sp.]|uniref:DUF6538 domain-containing protein n=1 Tax=uncultured Jannaschia sp. TaxID=293347 RepID=UPI003439F3CA